MKKKSKINISDLWNRVDFKKPSTLALVFSNILVILFAVIDGVTANEVMWVYWTQSVIIGIFNFIRLVTLREFSTEGFKKGNKAVLPNRATAISTGIFFLFHYGFFHIIYSVFLGTFSRFTNSSANNSGGSYFLLSAAIFFISYLIEFVNNSREKTDELPNIGAVMFAPYVRIIPMHLTIILGGFIGGAGSLLSVNTDIAVIILFTGLKTFVDLITHSVNLNDFKKKENLVTE